MINNIKRFTAEIFNKDMGINGVVIIKNDEIIIDEYREPYRKNEVYELFSLTKTMTALVIGTAIDKGIIKLEDTVVSFFSSKAPLNCSDNLNKMTIHNLLSMTTGRIDIDYYEIAAKTDWVKAFLELPVPYKPGSVYKYSSHTSHVLSAIIKTKTGMTLSEYAKDHFFAPLDITNYHWETWIDGNTIGGMGLALSTNDLAKIGKMILNKGKYYGKRILSEGFIDLATTNYIVENELNKTNNADEKYGYSFCFHKNNFYHEGAFGQLLYLLPKENIVIAIHSRKRVKGLLLGLIDKYILLGNNCYDEKDYVCTKKTILPAFKSLPDNRISFNAVIKFNENIQDISEVKLQGNDTKILFERIYKNNIVELIEFDYHNHVKTNLLFVKDQSKVIQPAILTAYWEDHNTLVLNTIYPETPYMVNHRFELFNNDENIKMDFVMNPSLGSLSEASPMDIHIQEKVQLNN